MSKQEEAGLILKLYELRREDTMRKARDWYFREFSPETMADFNSAMFSDKSAYLRMVITYWDMAAGLVNNGAIGIEMFDEDGSSAAAVGRAAYGDDRRGRGAGDVRRAGGPGSVSD